MTFLEHLDELRNRLIRSLFALGIGIAIAFPFRKKLYNLLLTPQNTRIQNLIADLIEGVRSLGLRSSFTDFFSLWLRASASDETPFIPNFRSPTEPFIALFKLVLVAGFIIAAPVILYQIWSFVLPALRVTERRIAVRLIALLSTFFALGVLFAFFIAAPLLLELSANLWRSADIVMKPENLWTFTDYMGFLIQIVLAFGIAFELPLVMAFLARVGIVEVRQYREKRRIAFFILIVAAAVLTPGDIVPMTMMALPMITLYEFGILLASLAARRSRRQMETVTDDSDGESTSATS